MDYEYGWQACTGLTKFLIAGNTQHLLPAGPTSGHAWPQVMEF